MAAPEKIYVDNLNHDFWYRTKAENSIEYTRTDAFIDKAEKYLNSKLYDWVRTMHPNPSVSPNVIIKQDFIDGFVKFMEG